ncbi:MAG: ABC transporter ATP-binding protein [Verrucomicrobia bacterium]|nr:ABC transporter ATP-binding protein [Verrucomicrobiota bacterium]
MIRLDDIAWHAAAFKLDGVAFTAPEARYSVLMGRTGCGKTSLLEIICGLRRPAAGRVWIGGRDVTDEPPGRRGIGYVPQDGALFPTMRVREQIGFALRLRRRPAEEVAARVDELAGQLGVAHLLDRRPPGLSGGERQRVALGRALAARPQVLLLDEPLSALDEETRDEMGALLKTIQFQHGVTVLHVTHNRREAAQLADALFRLDAGRVCECDARGMGDPR